MTVPVDTPLYVGAGTAVTFSKGKEWERWLIDLQLKERKREKEKERKTLIRALERSVQAKRSGRVDPYRRSQLTLGLRSSPTPVKRLVLPIPYRYPLLTSSCALL